MVTFYQRSTFETRQDEKRERERREDIRNRVVGIRAETRADSRRGNTAALVTSTVGAGSNSGGLGWGWACIGTHCWYLED